MQPMDDDPDGQAEYREGKAERLKERVYITFTALAIVLALGSEEESAGEAAVTLVIAVFGTLLAVFLADVVSHLAVHAKLPDRRRLREMAQVSFGALPVVVLPFAFVALAVFDVWRVDAALQAAAIALVVALLAVGFLAVRRIRIPVWQRLLVLFAEFALGFLVVALEFVAHG